MAFISRICAVRGIDSSKVLMSSLKLLVRPTSPRKFITLRRQVMIIGRSLRRPSHASRARPRRRTANYGRHVHLHGRATGLDASMPPWVQEGGFDRWRDRLRDADVRQRVMHEMRTPSDKWENLLLAAGSPEKVLLCGFKNENLKHLTGKTLAEVSQLRNKSAEETAMDLVIEDGSRVECASIF